VRAQRESGKSNGIMTIEALETLNLESHERDVRAALCSITLALSLQPLMPLTMVLRDLLKTCARVNVQDKVSIAIH
jgi:hypothetical protein